MYEFFEIIMRDILIHQYFGVDLHLTVIKKDLPKLIKQVTGLLNSL